MEYLPIVRSLIKTVVRKFYDPHHIVLVDIVLDKILIYDTELQKIMKMHNKEVNKLLVVLKEDKILKYENKVEVFEDKRQYLRTVYYINYVEIRDIIKYKIFKINKQLEEKLRNSVREGYYCKDCDKQFSALDAQIIMTNYVFKCDNCEGELVENIVNEVENTLNGKFMNNIQEIIGLLKKLDKFEIPSMDFFQLSEFKKECMSREDVKEESVQLIDDTNFEIKQESILNKDISQDKEDQEIVYNDDIVTVNGIPKKYSEITEEDKEQMNEEEYESFFEVFSKHDR